MSVSAKRKESVIKIAVRRIMFFLILDYKLNFEIGFFNYQKQNVIGNGKISNVQKVMEKPGQILQL